MGLISPGLKMHGIKPVKLKYFKYISTSKVALAQITIGRFGLFLFLYIKAFNNAIVCVISNLKEIVDSLLEHGNFLAKATQVRMSMSDEDHVIVAATACLPVFIVLKSWINRCNSSCPRKSIVKRSSTITRYCTTI